MAKTEIGQKFCAWEGKFNESLREIFDEANFNAGVMVILFCGWLTSVLIFSKFVDNDSYRNLANYIISAGLRRAVYVVHAMPVLKMLHDIKISELESCELFAFWETFLGVLEMETLTHICIERYVTARDKAKGLQPKNYNKLYFSISVLFAVVYSYPALMGLGGYGKNFPCAYYDMAQPEEGWVKFLLFTVVIGKSIKPMIFIVVMLSWAYTIEKSISNNEEPSNLTKGVVVLVAISGLCWAPITFFQTSALLNSFIIGTVQTNIKIVMFSLFAQQMAPGLGLLGLVAVDANLRSKMIELIKRIKNIFKAPATPPPAAKPMKSD